MPHVIFNTLYIFIVLLCSTPLHSAASSALRTRLPLLPKSSSRFCFNALHKRRIHEEKRSDRLRQRADMRGEQDAHYRCDMFQFLLFILSILSTTLMEDTSFQTFYRFVWRTSFQRTRNSSIGMWSRVDLVQRKTASPVKWRDNDFMVEFVMKKPKEACLPADMYYTTLQHAPIHTRAFRQIADLHSLALSMHRPKSLLRCGSS